jgi:chitinase
MKQRARCLCASAASLSFALTLTASSIGATDAVGADQGFRKVGYFTQWGIYARHFVVKNLQDNGSAGRLTHLNYAFGRVAPNSAGDVVCSSGDPWADYQKPFTASEDVNGVREAWGAPLRGNFNQLKKLTNKHPDLKVLISLGGWTWSRYFSDAARSPATRRTFVKSCIDLFIKGNLPRLDGGSGGPGAGAGVFDGIDLDWEWPGSPGRAGNIVRRVDRANFTKLVAEFRRQLNTYGGRTGKRYALTASLQAGPG